MEGFNIRVAESRPDDANQNAIWPRIAELEVFNAEETLAFTRHGSSHFHEFSRRATKNIPLDARKGGEDSLWSQRKFAHVDPGGVEEGVGNRSRGGGHHFFTRAG
jgi:hypothetical protein